MKQKKDEVVLTELEKFQALLNDAPDTDKLKTYNNSLYLPIGHIEHTLDQLYNGLWETYDFKYEVISNELSGSLVLTVFHPVAKIWIRRTGAAAVMITTRAKMPATMENKTRTALIGNVPSLLSSCLSNAAEKLGNAFGRSLNRDYAQSNIETRDMASEEREKKIKIAFAIIDKSNRFTDKENIKKKFELSNIKDVEFFIKKNKYILEEEEDKNEA